jgi:hypothetical protein
VQNDRHYLTLLRYVEANALRAKLVKRAQDWPWSSLACPATSDGRILLSRGPLERPPGWLSLVNQPLADDDLADVRTSLKRGRPFGGTPGDPFLAAYLTWDFFVRIFKIAGSTMAMIPYEAGSGTEYVYVSEASSVAFPLA